HRSTDPPPPPPFPTRRSSDLLIDSHEPGTTKVPSRPRVADCGTGISAARRSGGRGGAHARDPGGAAAADADGLPVRVRDRGSGRDRKSTRLNSSHVKISYAVF